MNAYDIFYGQCTLPDGRVVEATVHGVNRPDAWCEKGGFELAENDLLEIDSIDGNEPTETDYNFEYTINGQVITLTEYVIDYLCEHGTFEAWTPDEDDYL